MTRHLSLMKTHFWYAVLTSFVDHHLTVRTSLCELQRLLICLYLAISTTCISIRLLSVEMYLDG